MKHAFHDILTMFKTHLGHSEQHALQTVYDAGHAAGAEEVKDKLLEGDKDLHKELDQRFHAKIKANEPTVDQGAAQNESNDQQAGSTDETQKAKDPTDAGAAAQPAAQDPATANAGGEAAAPPA